MSYGIYYQAMIGLCCENYDDLDTAIETARVYAEATGQFTKVNENLPDGGLRTVWSSATSASQQKDDRWAALKVFVAEQLSGVENFQSMGAGNYRQALQAYQLILDKIEDLEAADGTTKSA